MPPTKSKLSRRILVSVLTVLGLLGLALGPVYLYHRLMARELAAARSASSARTARELVRDFHTLWYGAGTTWHTNTWLGIPTWQNPNDIWILQEIISEVKPDLIIEAGTFRGGSALISAMVLEQVNPAGKVVTIDIEDQVDRAHLPPIASRVEFIIGSSTDPKIVAQLAERARGKKVLVFLDSDHRKAHVFAELEAYGPMVSVGSYLIVQDTNVNGHPVLPSFGPGPGEAVAEFIPKQESFRIDRHRERLLFTFCPQGFLQKVR